MRWLFDENLTSDLKTVFASWADYVVLALCFGKSENCLALGAFAVDVGFSVAPFIFAKLEEAAESFVLPSSLVYIS